MTTAVAERKARDLPAQQDSGGAVSLLQAITRAASDPSVDIDKMERLMQMHERIVARDAEGAFNSAMRDCQAEMRPIATDAENPQTRSKYATHGRLDGALRPIYTKYGFSISYDEGDSPKPEHVRVLAYVSHVAGHTRTYHKDIPADGKGAKGGDVMTKTHASGAADSYGKRYLLKNIWNVAIGEDDNDGNGAKQGLSEAEFEAFKKKIEATLTKTAAKEAWALGVKACEAVGDIATAERLKEVLLAHGKFIDSAK
jgi:hypothetical protein